MGSKKQRTLRLNVGTCEDDNPLMRIEQSLDQSSPIPGPMKNAATSRDRSNGFSRNTDRSAIGSFDQRNRGDKRNVGNLWKSVPNARRERSPRQQTLPFVRQSKRPRGGGGFQVLGNGIRRPESNGLNKDDMKELERESDEVNGSVVDQQLDGSDMFTGEVKSVPERGARKSFHKKHGRKMLTVSYSRVSDLLSVVDNRPPVKPDFLNVDMQTTQFPPMSPFPSDERRVAINRLMGFSQYIPPRIRNQAPSIQRTHDAWHHLLDDGSLMRSRERFDAERTETDSSRFEMRGRQNENERKKNMSMSEESSMKRNPTLLESKPEEREEGNAKEQSSAVGVNDGKINIPATKPIITYSRKDSVSSTVPVVVESSSSNFDTLIKGHSLARNSSTTPICLDDSESSSTIPFSQKVVLTYKQISVTESDLYRLDPDGFLNDTLIEFYCTYLWDYVVPENERDSYFFCSPFLTLSILSNNGTTLERWSKTAKQSLTSSSLRYIIMPINSVEHWTVAIICLRSGVFRDVDGGCILFMDSLGGTSINFKSIRDWLKGWGITCDPEGLSVMRLKHVPHQNNGSDCGIYVLMYIENFIKNRPLCIADFSERWFSKNDVKMKRGMILDLIRNGSKTGGVFCNDTGKEQSSSVVEVVENEAQLCSGHTDDRVLVECSSESLTPPSMHLSGSLPKASQQGCSSEPKASSEPVDPDSPDLSKGILDDSNSSPLKVFGKCVGNGITNGNFDTGDDADGDKKEDTKTVSSTTSSIAGSSKPEKRTSRFVFSDTDTDTD